MSVTSFITGVPWWVALVLALLVWRGWQASTTRIVAFRTIFIGPAIFIGWGVVSLVTRAFTAPSLAAVWFGTALIGILLALTTVRVAIQVDHTTKTIRLPGSWWPMARYLGIFAAKFVLAAWAAIQPAMRADLAYWDVGVSGLSAGYFVGWLVRVVKAYQHAPSITASKGD